MKLTEIILNEVREDHIIRLALNVLAQRYACLRGNVVARRMLENGVR